MPDVSPVDEQARERVARAIFGEGKQALGIPERQTWEETEIGLQVFFVGLADAALAAARELTAAPAEAIKQAAERYRVEQCASRRESPPVAHWLAGYRAALAAARLVPAQARERTPWTGRALFERFEHEAERGRGWPRLSKVGKHSWDALAEQIEGEVLAAQPVPEDAGDERQPDVSAVEEQIRERIAEAIYEAERAGFSWRIRWRQEGERRIRARYFQMADAALAAARPVTGTEEER